jgi:hypothetical protein
MFSGGDKSNIRPGNFDEMRSVVDIGDKGEQNHTVTMIRLGG